MVTSVNDNSSQAGSKTTRDYKNTINDVLSDVSLSCSFIFSSPFASLPSSFPMSLSRDDQRLGTDSRRVTDTRSISICTICEIRDKKSTIFENRSF